MRLFYVSTTVCSVVALATALGGCGKAKQAAPQATSKARAEAKRHQSACASSAAYDRLKGMIFDSAVDRHDGDPANLNMLADYTFARMDRPVVAGWDAELDVTQCRGSLILQIPAGAERGLAGERQLQADVVYTAQAAADGNGLVYQIKGADAIIDKLAAFNLTRTAFQPPPAIDNLPATSPAVDAGETQVATATDPRPAATRPPATAPTGQQPQPTTVARRPAVPTAPENRVAERADVVDDVPSAQPTTGGDDGNATVRAFYAALGTGDGTAAAARIVPEKRTGRAYSPAAISRFYGGLPEPLRLTGIVPVAGGAYQVDYRYSAGRSHCNGRAIVNLTRRGGATYIRSIQALRGC